MKTLLRLGQGLACIFCWGETYNLPSYAYADLGFYLSIILKANQLYRIVHDRFKFIHRDVMLIENGKINFYSVQY